MAGCFSVEANLHPAPPLTCPASFHLISPFLMWTKLAWQKHWFSPLPVFPLAAAPHRLLTATDGRGYWGWKPPCLPGSPMAPAFRHILSHEGSCHVPDIKKMDGKTLCCSSSSSAALLLLACHLSTWLNGSQSEGAVMSVRQAAGKTLLVCFLIPVHWPRASPSPCCHVCLP